MKKKLFSILLVALSVMSFTACGKEEVADGTVSVNSSDTVAEETTNINYEDSILWNTSYSLNVRNMEIDYFYGKAISPNSNEVLYSSLYSQRCSTSYFNGTDWYVYTDIDPNGEVLEEKVWITGIDNPYEAFELDMYALTRPEVFEEEAYSVNLIDYCVF